MALADPSRREIVHRLAQQEHSVTDLAAHFNMSLAGVSKHVKVLEKAKVIKRRVEGRTHYLQLVPEQLTEALDWISIYRNFWQQRLNALSAILEHEEEK
jgi:DNA-binding transcriptional ArsR family regulator